MKNCSALTCGLMAAAIAAPAVAHQAADVVAFQTAVKVVVDARGEPTGVETSPALPQNVRDFVESRARDLAFEPAVIEGQSRGGVTYVVFGVCAVPAGDQMRMAAEYRGHGPGRRDGAAYPAPPRYPMDAARRGLSADMKVHYIVQPDGRATLDAVEFADSTRANARAPFERMAREWVGQMQMLPEQVNGTPISTRVSTPLTLTVGHAGSARTRDILQRTHDAQTGSPECVAAEQAQSGGQQLATARSAFVIRDKG